MKDQISIKYKVNYNPIFYNHETRRYESNNAAFLSYREAKSNQWRCEKCEKMLSTLGKLKMHKAEKHSY